MIVVGALRGSLVTERVAKDLVQERGIERGFLLGEMAFFLQVGPLRDNLVCLVAPFTLQEIAVRLACQDTRQDQFAPPAAAEAGEKIRLGRLRLTTNGLCFGHARRVREVGLV